MCSSSTKLSARLRMPLKPTNVTARETVLTLPPRAKCALFTNRSNLLVSAMSFRIWLVTLVTLSLSELAMRWMRITESDRAGKSLLWRMRRNKNSSVLLLTVVSALAASSAAAAGLPH